MNLDAGKLQKPHHKLMRFFVIFPLLFLLAESVSSKTLIFQTKEPEKLPTIDYSSTDAPAEKTVRKTKSKQASSPNSELFFMIEQLQQELGQVRSLVEEQANQIHHLKRNAKSRYLDLDSRVLNLSKKLNSKIPAKVSSATRAGSPAAPLSSASAVVSDIAPSIAPSVVSAILPAVVPVVSGGTDSAMVAKPPVVAAEPTQEQKQAYQAAYALIKAKKYEEAVEAFHSFIEKFPEGNLTGNAYYWLGEVYLVLPQLEQAKQSFSIVVSAYPGHGKVADALFKLGVSYDRLQDPAKSEIYLNEVQKKFPKSTAAKLAKSYKINR